MNFILTATATVALSGLILAAIALTPASGPNCPGMDPQWLGVCATEMHP